MLILIYIPKENVLAAWEVPYFGRFSFLAHIFNRDYLKKDPFKFHETLPVNASLIYLRSYGVPVVRRAFDRF